MGTLSGLTGGTSAWTQDFEFVRGEYAISGERVPYFSVVMTVNDARRYLNLAGSLGVDPEDPIDIEELMQRDINRERAAIEIATYLREPARIKFFNALTVVLMPVSEEGRPQRSFPPNVPMPSDTSSDDAAFETVQAGPVLIRQLRGSTAGYIRWQPDIARAIIIDGQHRFLALDKVHRELPLLLQSDVTSIPVLLLVLDSRAGFMAPTGAPGEIIKASRAIFTDINKYAVKVTPEREYLLDDRSLVPVCMRSIITRGIGGQSYSRSTKYPAKIPLAAVDWTRSGQSKFSDSYYVTTIQALYQLTVEVLGFREPSATNYNALTGWIETLAARLDLAVNDKWRVPELLARVTDAENQDQSFTLTSDEVDAAASGFENTVGQIITTTILKAEPYRRLLDAYHRNGLLGGQQELWLGQNDDGREAYRIQFVDDPQATAEGLASTVKSQYRLAYQVVFQRGFVVAAREVDAQREQLAAAWRLEDSSRQRVLNRWIDEFNAVIPATLKSDDFWIGAAIDLDRSINYNQMSKNAIMGLTILSTTMDVDLGNEETGITKSDLRAMLRSSRGPYALLASDSYLLPEPTDIQLEAAKRWVQALATIGPGRPTSPILGLVRTAARTYRQGIRRYIGQLATANGRILLEEEEDQLVWAHGARRLAAIATTRKRS